MILRVLIFLLPFWNMEHAQKQFSIVGTWDACDPMGNKSILVFTEDGFVSLTFDGEPQGGREFNFNNAIHSLTYTVEYNETPIQVTFKLVEHTAPPTEKMKSSAQLTFEDRENAKLVFDISFLPVQGFGHSLDEPSVEGELLTIKLSRKNPRDIVE